MVVQLRKLCGPLTTAVSEQFIVGSELTELGLPNRLSAGAVWGTCHLVSCR